MEPMIKGKRAFYGAQVGSVAAPCLAIIEWRLTPSNNLGIMGQCGGSGGQCQEVIREIAPRIEDEYERNLCLRILEVWDRWHLNDMKAGCEHQRELGWQDILIPLEELKNKRVNQREGKALAMWVTEKEHPLGVLCKPCPVCGYQYGTKWLKENIPDDVVREIVQWPSNMEVKRDR